MVCKKKKNIKKKWSVRSFQLHHAVIFMVSVIGIEALNLKDMGNPLVVQRAYCHELASIPGQGTKI